MTTELASLKEEEAARTMGVLDVDGKNELFDERNTHLTAQCTNVFGHIITGYVHWQQSYSGIAARNKTRCGYV